MSKVLTPIDIEDGKKISVMFSEVSVTSRAMALGYLSALRDKEVAEDSKEEQLQNV